ncbi:MAG TPA: hypothetical protein VLW51_04160 [Solirubrobacteraceae bacterium]|nr:hypothetical protein [Solirubrobacteraceae bacterium]
MIGLLPEYTGHLTGRSWRGSGGSALLAPAGFVELQPASIPPSTSPAPALSS